MNIFIVSPGPLSFSTPGGCAVHVVEIEGQDLVDISFNNSGLGCFGAASLRFAAERFNAIADALEGK